MLVIIAAGSALPLEPGVRCIGDIGLATCACTQTDVNSTADAGHTHHVLSVESGPRGTGGSVVTAMIGTRKKFVARVVTTPSVESATPIRMRSK